MQTVERIKKHFMELANNYGCIFENDYHSACAGLSDETSERLGNWLVSSGFRLRRGIGQQYKQELMKRIKHPDVDDVKDTKDRTHKNTDKEQESKRTCLEASQHLNHVIEELKCDKTKDEFLPAWKKREAAVPKDYVPTMRDMAQALIDYVRNNQSTFKNWREWINVVQQIDNPNKLQELWDYAGQGISEIPAEIAEEVTPVKTQPKLQYRTDDIVFEDTDEPEIELSDTSFQKKYNSVDPVDEHVRKNAKEEYTSKLKKKVKFDNDVVYSVDVAQTPAQKAAGLEVFESLPEGCGLLFPFESVDHVTFHMGRVRFPIDILFFMQDELGFKVAKIIHNAEPGALDLWSNPQTACVLELPGGTCSQDKIELGAYCQICEE